MKPFVVQPQLSGSVELLSALIAVEKQALVPLLSVLHMTLDVLIILRPLVESFSTSFAYPVHTLAPAPLPLYFVHYAIFVVALNFRQRKTFQTGRTGGRFFSRMLFIHVVHKQVGKVCSEGTFRAAEAAKEVRFLCVPSKTWWESLLTKNPAENATENLNQILLFLHQL